MACCNGCDKSDNESSITSDEYGNELSPYNSSETLASWGIWPPDVWFVIAMILFLLLLSHGNNRRP